jgi:hypothetical protein
VPDVAGSWVLPLDVQRRGPTAKSATKVALEQIAAVRTSQAVLSAAIGHRFDFGRPSRTLRHVLAGARRSFAWLRHAGSAGATLTLTRAGK